MQNYSVKEACKILGISRSMLYKLIKENKAPKIMKIGTRSLISYEALQVWLKQCER